MTKIVLTLALLFCAGTAGNLFAFGFNNQDSGSKGPLVDVSGDPEYKKDAIFKYFPRNANLNVMTKCDMYNIYCSCKSRRDYQIQCYSCSNDRSFGRCEPYYWYSKDGTCNGGSYAKNYSQNYIDCFKACRQGSPDSMTCQMNGINWCSSEMSTYQGKASDALYNMQSCAESPTFAEGKSCISENTEPLRSAEYLHFKSTKYCGTWIKVYSGEANDVSSEIADLYCGSGATRLRDSMDFDTKQLNSCNKNCTCAKSQILSLRLAGKRDAAILEGRRLQVKTNGICEGYPSASLQYSGASFFDQDAKCSAKTSTAQKQPASGSTDKGTSLGTSALYTGNGAPDTNMKDFTLEQSTAPVEEANEALTAAKEETSSLGEVSYGSGTHQAETYTSKTSALKNKITGSTGSSGTRRRTGN